MLKEVLLSAARFPGELAWWVVVCVAVGYTLLLPKDDLACDQPFLTGTFSHALIANENTKRTLQGV